MTHTVTYDEIFAHLDDLPAHIAEVTIRVDELERANGREFPPSAHTDDPAYTWWENDRQRSGSRSWVALGWRKTGPVEREASGRALRVRFRRAEAR